MTQNPFPIRLAIIQYAMTANRTQNLMKACEFVRQAASKGAHIALLPELFETRYFPQQKNTDHFILATRTEQNPAVTTLKHLARELRIVIPISFFEKSDHAFYNSVLVVDADGKTLGIYRKSHIPDGPGYQEKFYFQNGDTGFRVFNTRYACLGIGICWDQWFPECSRAMTLLGADLILYPSAIGSEPHRPDLDTKDAWQKAMVGQAICNSITIAAANRVGDESGQIFYGSSFAVDHMGRIKAELDRHDEGTTIVEIDLESARKHRQWFGLVTDRRTDLYGILTRKSPQ